MLKYMTLIRGDAEVTYPIYEISDLSKMNFTVAGTSSNSIKFVAYGCSPTSSPDGVQAAFADVIPTTAAEYGNITQNNLRFVLDTATQKQYCPDAHFVVVPVGEKPADWDTNYFDYYTYQTGQVGNWGNVPSPVYPPTNPREIPIWESTSQYYKADTPTLQERFNHLFFTKAGYSFGVWSMSGQGEGEGAYAHASFIACNPRYTGIMDDAYSYVWRDQNGEPMNHSAITMAVWYAYWRTNCMDIAPPVSGQQIITTPLTSDRRDMQIFCYCEYRGEMYYGVMAIAIDSNGELTNARALMFTADFWGDSVSDTPPEPEPQEGEWGDPIARAGGHGSFSDPSDDSGAFDGTALAADIAAHTAIMNANIQAGGFHVYRLAAGAMAAITRVLFSQSFFGLFTVSRYNPLSCMLSYHLLPSTLAPLTLDGTAQTAAVKAGGYNFQTDPDAPVQVPVQSLVDSEAHYFVGAADIPLFYDAFPDFAPFTSAKIHLPYIGEMALDINKFQGGKIAVDYNCDVISGNVCAVITCQDRNNRRREVYTATGNAAYTLPIFSESQSGAAVGKLIGSGVMAAVTGNAAGVMGAAAGALEMAAVGVPHSPQIQGSFGGNVGAIGNRICFLEITRPEWVETERFQELTGIPSGLSGTIANLGASGFIQVQTIETEGIPATQAECDLIEQILKSGIYVK